jgi:hypothetical protein
MTRCGSGASRERTGLLLQELGSDRMNHGWCGLTAGTFSIIYVPPSQFFDVCHDLSPGSSSQVGMMTEVLTTNMDSHLLNDTFPTEWASSSTRRLFYSRKQLQLESFG